MALEFRIPLSLLGSPAVLRLTYVDVDDELQRDILRVTQTLPPRLHRALILWYCARLSANIVQGLGLFRSQNSGDR